MITWTKHGLMLTDEQWPQYFSDLNWQQLTRSHPGRAKPPRGWCKSGAMLSEQVNGLYWMYFGDTHIWAAYSSDLSQWHIVPEPVLSPREGSFDSFLVEPGPPPLILQEGIWLGYNGAARIDPQQDSLRYSCGQALFSLEDPTRLIRRSPKPILQVKDGGRAYGRVAHEVVFCEGIVNFKDEWLLYYGIEDGEIGVAVGRRPAAEN